MRRVLILLAFAATAPFVLPNAAHAAEDFTLSADFAGLYPGVDADVPVSVHNSRTYPIVVHSASVTVGDAGPTCTAANVTAHSFSGTVVVPAGGEATVAIRMHMAASAPDTCQGATFPLTFTASGESVTDSGTSGFAFTGGNPIPLALGGAAAIVTGALLVFRRRHATTEATR